MTTIAGFVPSIVAAVWLILAQGHTLVRPIVLRVTSLESNGAGSLRQALDDGRPRIVVFEVGGVIDLHGNSLSVRNPHLTIAGQTAPDPGITIIRGGLTIETYDVIVQHISARLGDAGGVDDSLGARRAHDVLFDHCSATWAVDENLSVSGPADVDASRDPEATSHDVTLRSCLIAEGLMHANHPKGAHSMGTLIHDGVRGIVIEGCLYAHNNERNPRLKGGSTARVIGNVMYDWGSACVGVGARGNQKMLVPAEALLVDNVAIPGPSTTDRSFIKSLDVGGRLTMRDNIFVTGALRDKARKTVEHVLRTAGARPAHRDPIDARIVQSVIDRTGRIIDSQDQVGGYPLRASTRRALVVPDDHREEWLRRLSDEVTAPSPSSRR